MNSLRRYTQLTAPNKPREAAVVFSPTEGCRGADVTSLQPAGMTHVGEQRALHGLQQNTLRVGGGAGGHCSGGGGGVGGAGMTLGAWEGGAHLDPQHQGLEGGHLLEDLFPWVVLNNSAPV